MHNENIIFLFGLNNIYSGKVHDIHKYNVKIIGSDSKFSYFSSKTYVVGTQKNRLNETVLLSTQNIC